MLHIARQPRPRSSDHYYWLTAYLTARGLRAGTCRLIAVVIVGVGSALVAALISSSPGPMGWPSQVLCIAITLCCLGMGPLWMRHTWPTRRQSKVCVVVGTLGTAGVAMVAPMPVLGLLAATAFTALSAYSALFHSTRLLAFTWSVGAVTVVARGLLLTAAANVALAAAGVVLVMLVNIFVAFSSRILIRLLDRDINTDIEPLTGLLDGGAFYDQVATLIGARCRTDDRHLVVLVLSIDGFSLLTAMYGESGANQARVAAAQTLRETLRRDAILAHVRDAEFLVADVFTSPDPSVLTERVRGAIRTAGRLPLTASIGAVSTPLGPLAGQPPYDVCSELLTIASAAMFDARKVGGNRTCLQIDPMLTTLHEPDEGYPEASA